MRTNQSSKCRLPLTTKSTIPPPTKLITAGKHHDHIQLLNYQLDAEEQLLTFILSKPIVTVIHSRLTATLTRSCFTTPFESQTTHPLILISFKLLIESNASLQSPHTLTHSLTHSHIGNATTSTCSVPRRTKETSPLASSKSKMPTVSARKNG
jgi:hypothetical protein